MRCDEYRTDFSLFIDKMLNNPNKIITDNCFFRSEKYAKYCSSDHCIGGKTDILLQVFETIKNKCENGIYLSGKEFHEEVLKPTQFWCGDIVYAPEQVITTEIIKAFGESIRPEISKEQMIKYFDLVRLKDMGQFLIVANHERKQYTTENAMGALDILILTKIENL